MFKKIFTFTIIAILATMISFCGKKEEPKEEPKVEAKTTDSGLDGKIKAYEDFVTKYCALADKMKAAPASEKVALAKDFKADGDNLKTLQADIDDAKTATADQTSRVKAAAAKAAGCTATALGASPSVIPALPKAPKIPGM